MADLDYFIKDRNIEIDKTYGQGVRKWMTIGGSYPGALSAWFKSQYNLAVTAAWSSSGVINAIRDYSEFDLDVFQATSRSGSFCPTTIKKVIDYAEKALLSKLPEDEVKYFKGIFKNDNLDNGDFMYYFADIFAGSVQRGKRTNLCDMLGSIKDASV